MKSVETCLSYGPRHEKIVTKWPPGSHIGLYREKKIDVHMYDIGLGSLHEKFVTKWPSGGHIGLYREKNRRAYV